MSSLGGLVNTGVKSFRGYLAESDDAALRGMLTTAMVIRRDDGRAVVQPTEDVTECHFICLDGSMLTLGPVGWHEDLPQALHVGMQMILRLGVIRVSSNAFQTAGRISTAQAQTVMDVVAGHPDYAAIHVELGLGAGQNKRFSTDHLSAAALRAWVNSHL